MSDYIISCCSTADLSEKHFLERDIHYICFHYELDGVTYMDDLGKTMDIEDFYKAMTEGADTKTSQINADEYEKYFEGLLKTGKGYTSYYAFIGYIRNYQLCTDSGTDFNGKVS